MGDGIAYRTVVDWTAEGKKAINLEPITCTPTGHIYPGIISRGARVGLPRLGVQCVCGDERWTPAKEQELQNARRDNRVVEHGAACELADANCEGTVRPTIVGRLCGWHETFRRRDARTVFDVPN